jgi:ribonuclease BN (tRNA processing enzyme)
MVYYLATESAFWKDPVSAGLRRLVFASGHLVSAAEEHPSKDRVLVPEGRAFSQWLTGFPLLRHLDGNDSFREVEPRKLMDHSRRPNMSPSVSYSWLLAGVIFLSGAHAQTQAAPLDHAESGTQVVFLGTGTPRPQPDHQGQSIAIVVNGKAYLVDAGIGVTRQASAATLTIENLSIVFLTHLHSDHTLGLPDLIFTPWVMGRTAPLELYGPTGTKAMAENILKAYEQDTAIRIHGLEAGNATGYKVVPHEIRPGIVYQDSNVKVTAFPVEHGSWPEAYGYRFEAAGKTIVISGDTQSSKNVINACNGCDVLIHEVYSGYGGTSQKSPEEWMKYMAAFHTSAEELGILATQARAKTLVVTHYVSLGSSNPAEMVNTVKRGFAGTVIVAHDLDVIAP